jgi:DNA-binding response OmpR family regulator
MSMILRRMHVSSHQLILLPDINAAMSSHPYIMIIDDEPDTQEILSYNLKREGYQVRTFPNPLPAIESLKIHIPDLILTDWLMPEMDGLEFTRFLKSNDNVSCIPVIMITCKGGENDIETALELGAEDYLVKPFRIKDLIARIRMIL